MNNDTRFVIETDGLTKRFGDRVAVNGVELRVPRGSALGYLGPNGAGKRTLIRMLLGLTDASSGTMRLLGLPVAEQRGTTLAPVGAIVEEPRFHPFLSGRENLQVAAAVRGAKAGARACRLDRHSPRPRCLAHRQTRRLNMRRKMRMRRPSFLIGMSSLVALAAFTVAGCGFGSGGPESKISETTDSYLRALSSGDTSKACAQLTDEAQKNLGTSCVVAVERIAAAVGRDRLAEAADTGSSISFEGSNGSATLKELHVRIGLIDSGSNWLIKSGYELDGAS